MQDENGIDNLFYYKGIDFYLLIKSLSFLKSKVKK